MSATRLVHYSKDLVTKTRSTPTHSIAQCNIDWIIGYN